MASPAPFTTQPTLPSSLMNERLARRAAASLGSSAESSRSTPRSGRQKSSLSSMTILASSASTRPSGVVTSGLISASDAPLLTNARSEEHTSELQSLAYLVCRLLLEKKKKKKKMNTKLKKKKKIKKIKKIK